MLILPQWLLPLHPPSPFVIGSKECDEDTEDTITEFDVVLLTDGYFQLKFFEHPILLHMTKDKDKEYFLKIVKSQNFTWLEAGRKSISKKYDDSSRLFTLRIYYKDHNWLIVINPCDIDNMFKIKYEYWGCGGDEFSLSDLYDEEDETSEEDEE